MLGAAFVREDRAHTAAGGEDLAEEVGGLVVGAVAEDVGQHADRARRVADLGHRRALVVVGLVRRELLLGGAWPRRAMVILHCRWLPLAAIP